jgi:DNA-binding NarL/FixJ family response regulator
VIRLLIAAPSAVMRAGIESLVASHPSLTPAGAPIDPDDLEEAIDEARPDILLLVTDGGGNEGEDGREGRLPANAPPTILLAADPRAEWIQEAYGRAVRAVLPLDALPEEIVAACEAAAAGLVVARPGDMRALASERRARRPAEERRLTPREIEVLRMIADGAGNKAIAFRLGISDHTVKFHVGSIMSKLGAASRTEAVAEGFRRGLILL